MRIIGMAREKKSLYIYLAPFPSFMLFFSKYKEGK